MRIKVNRFLAAALLLAAANTAFNNPPPAMWILSILKATC